MHLRPYRENGVQQFVTDCSATVSRNDHGLLPCSPVSNIDQEGVIPMPNRASVTKSASLTIADISLYAYTHVAHEGGFELEAYVAIGKWMKRIEQHANYVAMNS